MIGYGRKKVLRLVAIWYRSHINQHTQTQINTNTNANTNKQKQKQTQTHTHTNTHVSELIFEKPEQIQLKTFATITWLSELGIQHCPNC